MKRIQKIIFGILLVLTLLSLFSFVFAGELRVTQEHPFYVDDSWMPAKNLVVGDILQTADGGKVRITSIEDVISEKPFPVYNFEDTFGINNYIVNGGDGIGVVVHNSNAETLIVSSSLSAVTPKEITSVVDFVPQTPATILIEEVNPAIALAESKIKAAIVFKNIVNSRNSIITKTILEKSANNIVKNKLKTLDERTNALIAEKSLDVELISTAASRSKYVYRIKTSAYADIVEFAPGTPEYLIMKRTRNLETFVEKEIWNGLDSLTFESINSDRINYLFKLKHGRNLVAEEYAPVIESISRVSPAKFKNNGGYSFTKPIEGDTFKDFQSNIGKKLLSATSEQQQNLRELAANLLNKLPQKETDLQSTFKEARLYWWDYKSDNIMLVFKDSSGKIVTLDEISGSFNLAKTVDVEMVIVDLGGITRASFNEAGAGFGRAGTPIPGGPTDPHYAYNNLMDSLGNVLLTRSTP